MNVVLFDIDGTLISTRGGGKRAMQAALREHFGTSGPDSYRYDGKTDRQIARELMREAGFDDATIDARMASVIEHYLTGLRGDLARAEEPHVYPGIHALLDALEARHDVMIGLLTGNVEPGAHAKLSAAKLAPARFRVGAFGSDHERRDELPEIARARAAALLERELAGNALVIIGDTPNDLTCGKRVGARAIGVATGSYTEEALSAHAPWAVFADLSDTARVLAAILRAAA
ncbi:MAG TPA: HAD family hydrolase [Gemmatimonadaceae bacterium]|nr:HAD family hydrolase [Gemmatimonadaceae bacterium]